MTDTRGAKALSQSTCRRRVCPQREDNAHALAMRLVDAYLAAMALDDVAADRGSDPRAFAGDMKTSGLNANSGSKPTASSSTVTRRSCACRVQPILFSNCRSQRRLVIALVIRFWNTVARSVEPHRTRASARTPTRGPVAGV
jgi:hypothetical protein